MSKRTNASDGRSIDAQETENAEMEVETPDEFDAALEKLLDRGFDAGVSFDRSWTFRDSETERPDLMVEITELARRPEVPDGEE